MKLFHFFYRSHGLSQNYSHRRIFFNNDHSFHNQIYPKNNLPYIIYNNS
jgi:hypothetical protein